MWVPTWGPSRVDVGADVGFVFWVRYESDKRPVWRASPEFDSYAPRFAFLIRWEMALRARFRGNKTRSDHDVQAVPAIQCVTSMVREQRYPM